MFFAEIKDIKDVIFVKIKDIKEFTSHICYFFLNFRIHFPLKLSKLNKKCEAVRVRLGAEPLTIKKSKQLAAGGNFFKLVF